MKIKWRPNGERVVCFCKTTVQHLTDNKPNLAFLSVGRSVNIGWSIGRSFLCSTFFSIIIVIVNNNQLSLPFRVLVRNSVSPYVSVVVVCFVE